MPSLQETFDIVVTHARKQNKKAADSNGKCKYRYQTCNITLMCFAGCLVPDTAYHSSWEGAAVVDAFNQPTNPGRCIQHYGYDLMFVRRLQKIHDNYSVKNWEEEFQKLALQYQLQYVPVGE